MGVDEHILAGRIGVPAFNGQEQQETPKTELISPNAANGAFKELRTDIRKLTTAITGLMDIFKQAHEDIKSEPTTELIGKMDKLIEQNDEISRAMLMLLELHKEHLPQISRHTRMSSELKLRKPPHTLFSERLSRK
ncbi:hypothetical protein HYU12_02005 [Candidatus Woesearchaeota archaeon]|nr:hypothetical protein [Candidatus Woesearchaeota archaeon]